MRKPGKDDWGDLTIEHAPIFFRFMLIMIAGSNDRVSSDAVILIAGNAIF